MRRLTLLVAVGLASLGNTRPATPMRGVSWEGQGPITAASLDPVRELGADWISQMPFGWCRAKDLPELRFSGTRGLWGESDAGLTATAEWARARGLKTLLKPHLWLRGGVWVGELEMKNEADWRRFFEAYEAFILHYARLAERVGMEALAVGTELPKASGRTAEWRRLIAAVRGVYGGRLTYCANWHEAEAVGFWDALDFVGVQAYYPLPAERPSRAALTIAWNPLVERLARLHAATGKEVVFTEVGYKSLAGSLREPWRWDTAGTPDYALQSDAYAAMFASVWEKPWFGGAFIWKWHPDLGAPEAPPPGREGDFTPQGKPALRVIRRYYRSS